MKFVDQITGSVRNGTFWKWMTSYGPKDLKFELNYLEIVWFGQKHKFTQLVILSDRSGMHNDGSIEFYCPHYLNLNFSVGEKNQKFLKNEVNQFKDK
jgi:hypothetical protein